MNGTRKMIKEFIVAFMARQHYAPTVEEIRAGCGLSTKSLVDYHLNVLEANGEIRTTPKTARSIVVVM
jgi:SOS-response transcriptional repressor LexA